MRRFFLLLFTVFLLSGCVEIIEKVKINSDQSGSVEYRVKVAGNNSLLANISGMFNNNMEDQLRSEGEKLADVLKTQAGISNVEYKFGRLTDDFYIRFDFNDSDAFNEALYQTGGYKKTCFSPGYLKIKQHKVKKRNFTPWIKQYLKKEKIEISQSLLSDMLTFKSVINLPEPAHRIKPENLSVSNNKTSISQQLSFTEILQEGQSTGIKIRY